VDATRDPDSLSKTTAMEVSEEIYVVDLGILNVEEVA
jgi:hypothetical protein